jgi:cell shape-determining protein MreD
VTALQRLRRRLFGTPPRQRQDVRRAILGSLPIGAGKRERHRLWRVALWGVLALILYQATSGLFVHLRHPFVRVDVASMLLFFVVLELGTLEGALSAFVLGYVADLFVGGPPGLCCFLAVAIWTLAHLLPPRAFRSSWLGASILASGISAAFQVGILGAEALVRPSWEAPGTIAWLSVVPVAMISASLAVPLRSLLCRVDRMTAGSLPGER